MNIRKNKSPFVKILTSVAFLLFLISNSIQVSATTIERRIDTGTDDAEEGSSGSISTSSSDLELVFDKSNQIVGMRFIDLTIPEGATIDAAYIQFEVDETNSGFTSLSIYGEDIDSAETYVKTSNNISSRSATSAAVSWEPPPWVSDDAHGPNQQTPDISAVVQEIVNHPGWNSGNALAIMISGTGERTAKSYNGSKSSAPLLHIEYTVGPPVNQSPIVEGGANKSIVLPGNSVSLDDASATDDGLPFATLDIEWTVDSATAAGDVTFNPSSSVQNPTVTFPASGTYVLRMTAIDGDLENSDTVTVTVKPEGTETISIDKRVAASEDDAEEQEDGGTDLGSSDLELVYDRGDNQTVGMRFIGLNIPKGAQIEKASIQFTTDDTNSGDTSLLIKGEATGFAENFTSSTNDISSRTMTSTSISWEPQDWNTGNAQGADQQTPDIASIIQEIVDNPDWNTDNALAIIITGTGERTAHSYDGSPSSAPLLHVEYTTGPPGNKPPVVEGGANKIIVLPIDSVSLNDASATDDDLPSATLDIEWTVESATVAGDVTFSPSSTAQNPTVTFPASGTYVLRMTAADGEFVRSDTVNVTVEPEEVETIPPPGNTPPVVEAGANKIIVLPDDSVSLNDASATDDGLPFATLEIEWTVESATVAGNVTFAPDTTVQNPTVTFPASGTYVLRMTATDGDLENSDTVTVTVMVESEETETISIDKRVAASEDDAEEQEDGGTDLGSSDLELVRDRSNDQTVGMRFTGMDIPKDALIQNAWIQFVTDDTNSGDTILLIKGESTGSAENFTSSDNNITSREMTSAAISWEPLDWNTRNAQGADQQTPDISSIIQEIVDNPEWDSGNALAIIITGTGERTAHSFDGSPSSAPLLHVEYTTGPPGNKPPVVEGGVNKIIVLPIDSVSLNDASATDDDLPSATLGIEWTVVSATEDGETVVGDVIFDTGTTDLNPTVTFPGRGTYELRLTADDGELTNSDTVTITVQPEFTPPDNTAPVVEGGANKTIILPVNSVSLDDASATDDGLPSVSLGIEWTVVSATEDGATVVGDVMFDTGTTDLNPTVTFPGSGTYELRLRADDGELTNSDTVTITVQPEPTPLNSLPVVELSANSIVDEPKRPGTFELTSAELLQDTGVLDMGIEIRGATSQRFPKKSFSLELRKDSDPNADEKKVVLLGMRKDGDWLLDATYRDTSFVRNLVSYDIYNDMQPYAHIDSLGTQRGQASIRGTLVEVILNEQYHGLYILEESLDRKLLDLDKINVPEDESGKKMWDEVDFSDPANGSVLYKADSNDADLYHLNVSSDFSQKYPDDSDITHWEPLEELAEFIIEASDEEFINNIGDIFNIDSAVDYWLLTQITGNRDTLKKNYYLARNASDLWFFVPWDYDATFGLLWDGSPYPKDSWWDPEKNNLIRRLSELTDTGFNTKVKLRWNELRTTIFTEEALIARFIEYREKANLENARTRNFERWPESGGEGVDDPELGTIEYIQDWIQRRIEFLDEEILSQPE